MYSDSSYQINLVIDNLTNSIRRVDSGESFETDVLPVTDENIKIATKKNGWHFTWKTEHRRNDRSVFKLIKSDEPDVIQGLLSLSDLEGYVYVHLAERAPINFGLNKLH
jgi:hypothetical protein